MIFEIITYQAKLLGEVGERIVDIDLRTRVLKGFVLADNEPVAAQKVGLIKLPFADCEESLREWSGRYYFPRGTQEAAVMADWQKGGQRLFERGSASVFVISRVDEIAPDHFARDIG